MYATRQEPDQGTERERERERGTENEVIPYFCLSEFKQTENATNPWRRNKIGGAHYHPMLQVKKRKKTQ